MRRPTTFDVFPSDLARRFMDPLTARETEVMRLVAGGYSNLGVRDRVQAVLRALESGLI